MAEYVIDTPLGRLVGDRLLADPNLHIPHLASIETASVIRGWMRGGLLHESKALRAMADLSDSAAERHGHDP